MWEASVSIIYTDSPFPTKVLYSPKHEYIRVKELLTSDTP